MANTHVVTKINGIKVWCDVYAEPYVPAYRGGHPDNWTPAEGGEIDIETVLVERKGRALIDGKWVDCDRVEINILPLLSDDAIETLMDKCYEYLNSVEE